MMDLGNRRSETDPAYQYHPPQIPRCVAYVARKESQSGRRCVDDQLQESHRQAFCRL